MASGNRSSFVAPWYARVSTADQHVDLPLDALRKADCQRICIYQEKVSGARAGRGRPELARLLEQLREENVMVLWKLDRLARSTRDLLEIMAAIQAAGAGFRSLPEPWADTTSHAGKLMMTIFAGIAEFERALITERTQVGRTAAKERGVRFGRSPGTRYLGTLTDPSSLASQRLRLIFTEQTGTLLRAEVSMPDKPAEHRSLSGELVYAPQRDSNFVANRAYPMRLSAADGKQGPSSLLGRFY